MGVERARESTGQLCNVYRVQREWEREGIGCTPADKVYAEELHTAHHHEIHLFVQFVMA
jgi:hypothetical protein